MLRCLTPLRAAFAIALIGLLGASCGDDSSGPGGAGGSGGTAGSGTGGSGGSRDGAADAMADAFVRGDGGYPGNIGAPCDPANGASDCGSTSDYRCYQQDFFGCTPGFCSKTCDTQPCPTGSVCADLETLSPTGQPLTFKRCFLPCNATAECGDPGRLYCDIARHICSSGQFLENNGTLGARMPGGQACVANPPAPARTLFGPNVAASNPTLTRPSEPHVAVDPSNTDIVYVTYNGGGGSTVSVTQNASAATPTWTHHSIGQLDPGDGGDPVLAVDPSRLSPAGAHPVWHVYLTGPASSCGPTAQYPGNNRIRAIHSLDHGATWVNPVTVNAPMYSADAYFLDKPWLHIAPNGTIYATFTVFPTGFGATTTDIVLATSRDGGQSFTNLLVNDTTPDRARGRQLSGMATDAASNLYLVWNEDTGNPDDIGGYVYLAKSADNGATVTHPNIRVNPSSDAVFDDPQIAAAPDGSKLYLVYGSAIPGGQADAEDIKATFSLDGGTTWQAPVRINDDPSCATHWHPAAVADASGNLWAIWYDVRYGDGRVRWAKGVVRGSALDFSLQGWVTDAAPPFTTSRTTFFLGDYIGLAQAGGKLFAAWGDLREVAAGRGVRMYFAQGLLQ